MDNVIPVPPCGTLITCAHALRLASTSNQLLCTGTGTPAPLLITGPSLPPECGTNQHAPRCSYCLLRGTRSASSLQSPRAPPAPYSAMQSTGAPHSAALQPMTGMLWSNQPTPYASTMHPRLGYVYV